jgi:DNA-binding NarL/FixJ family response regulator
MSKTRIRLTVDSDIEDERGRAKLVELHQNVVEQVSRLDIAESIRITLEYENAVFHSDKAGMEEQSEDQPAGYAMLSDRQRQIAFMLCEHFSIRRIAAQLFVSENTVKKHIQNLKKALHIEQSGADFVFELTKLLHVRKAVDGKSSKRISEIIRLENIR